MSVHNVFINKMNFVETPVTADCWTLVQCQVVLEWLDCRVSLEEGQTTVRGEAESRSKILDAIQ